MSFLNASVRAESGLTSIKEERMLARAVKRGWLKGQRWATDVGAKELMEIQKQRDLTLRERVIASVLTDTDHDDPRVRAAACKTALAMEAQNMVDEVEQAPPPVPTINIGVNVDARRDRIREIAERLRDEGVLEGNASEPA